MLFTCPGPVARGGDSRKVKGRRRHLCVDVHCHVHYPPADEMVKDVFRRESEPAMRFTNELSRATNQQQAQNVLTCLTSVEQRLEDMDKMGVDVQAISCSPFQFIYSLDPEHGCQTARAINENLAAIVQQHPDRFVALADRILVMHDGRIVGDVARADASERTLGLMMAGLAATQA